MSDQEKIRELETLIAKQREVIEAAEILNERLKWNNRDISEYRAAFQEKLDALREQGEEK
jgi:uncharacterized coiled-coil protein SlyX